jgi:hypothetical protein
MIEDGMDDNEEECGVGSRTGIGWACTTNIFHQFLVHYGRKLEKVPEPQCNCHCILGRRFNQVDGIQCVLTCFPKLILGVCLGLLHLQQVAVQSVYNVEDIRRGV